MTKDIELHQNKGTPGYYFFTPENWSPPRRTFLSQKSYPQRKALSLFDPYFFFAREIQVVSICQAEDRLGWGAQGDHCEPHSRGAAGGERAGGHTSTTAGRAVGARHPADPCGKGCVTREGCTANPCTTGIAATWEPDRSPLLPSPSQDLPFDFNTPARS